jgi:hypothetical protein
MLNYSEGMVVLEKLEGISLVEETNLEDYLISIEDLEAMDRGEEVTINRTLKEVKKEALQEIEAKKARASKKITEFKIKKLDKEIEKISAKRATYKKSNKSVWVKDRDEAHEYNKMNVYEINWRRATNKIKVLEEEKKELLESLR